MLNLSIEDQVKEIVLLRDNEDMTFADIAMRYGFSERTARRRYAAAILVDEEKLEDFPEVEDLELGEITDFLDESQQDEIIERFKPLIRVGDAAVICDLHIPLHTPELINKFIDKAKSLDIKNLIIAGDYWNMDELSHYPPHQPEASLVIERREGNRIMKILLRHFDYIDFIWGNHDFRLSKKLGFKKSFEECMEWMFYALTDDERARIRISDLDFMEYYPEGTSNIFGEPQKWRICHPRNFSSAPLSVGRALALKYKCSVLTGHSHHCAFGMAMNGVDMVIEGGGFYDKYKTEYIQKSNKHHEWVPGFTIFKDGVPTVYSPAFGNI